MVWVRRKYRRQRKVRNRLFRGERLEERALLASDWQNPFTTRDVSRDGVVTPIDALVIVNELNLRTVIGSQGSLPARAEHPNRPYWDASGDNSVTPIDILVILNALNGDRLGPTIVVGLASDTAPDGATNTDKVTADPTIQGTVQDNLTGVGELLVTIDGRAPQRVQVEPNGSFQFDPGIARGGSADGLHRLRMASRDGLGNLATELVFDFVLDTLAPPAPALWLNPTTDTGISSTDGVTRLRNVIAQGDATEGWVEVYLNGQPVSQPFAGEGWSVTLESLADGDYMLTARATDLAGNVGPLSPEFKVTVDTVAPDGELTARLARSSDTGAVGDGVTSVGRVTLVGETEPNSPVSIVGTGIFGLAGQSGAFQITGVPLTIGDNPLQVAISDLAGNERPFPLFLQRTAAPDQTDPVLAWNATLLDAIRQDASVPTVASRVMAMMHVAILDAVSAVEGQPTRYLSLAPARSASIPAAVATAAHRVLTYAFPAQRAALDAALVSSLAEVPEGDEKVAGIALGESAGDAVIAWRAADGWDEFVSYVPSTLPGDWRPTVPTFAPGLSPQWADLVPFSLESPHQFRPPGPPDLSSTEYAAAVQEVQTLGGMGSTARTADQTQIARFWIDGGGTATPPGHWNQIASEVAKTQGNSLGENARLFAELNIALADAAITAWDAKYTAEFWRPVTAIASADVDNNAATAVDRSWHPLLVTPPFPEYVSGHSTFSGAAAEVLALNFGNDFPFTTTSDTLPGVERSFSGFHEAAAEAGQSRIYGGIHFQFSNQDGLAAGRAIAQQVHRAFLPGADTNAPRIVVDNEPGLTTAGNVTVTGSILDNLSGVTASTVSVDGGEFTALAIGADGRFQLLTGLPLDGSADGNHQLTFRSTDAAGNTVHRSWTFVLDSLDPTIEINRPAVGAELRAGAVLAGTASGTGSALVSLHYSVDGGPVMPITFARNSGAFSQPLDLSGLPAGPHEIVVQARDGAGRMTSRSLQVQVPQRIAFSLTSHLPASGAQDIGVTFRPRIDFSRPVNLATLNSSNLFLSDTAGNRLPATIVPANDGSFVWLFPQQPMPGASQVTVTVDGNSILAATGELLDADGNGVAGGQLQFRFSTVSRAVVPNTSIAGVVADPGPDLKPGTFDDVRAGPDGVLMTADDVYLLPIAGAKVFILGREDQTVSTDAAGRFSLDGIPAGNIKLAIDGQVATSPPAGVYFPEMVMDLNIRAGIVNRVMAAMEPDPVQSAARTEIGAYLPRLQTSLLRTVTSDQKTMIGVDATSAPNLTPQQRSMLSIEVQPNSLIGTNGQQLTQGQVGISTVPADLVRDMLPPGVLEHTFDITVQAPGISNFSAPAPMTFPNVFQALPGSKLNFLSFDHTTGRLVIEGTATVSEDGLSVHTDPGTGITHPGWHGVTPPGDPGSGGPPEDCGGGTPPGPTTPGGEGEGDQPETRVMPLIFGSGSVYTPKYGFSYTAPDEPMMCTETPPQILIKITIDGPVEEFLSATGDIPLQSGQYELRAGTNATKRFGFEPKPIKEMYPQGFVSLSSNILYGGRIDVRVEEQLSDGAMRLLKNENIYVSRFIDATDGDTEDAKISFPKTLPNVRRELSIDFKTGGSSRPTVSLTDTSGPFSLFPSTGELSFTPKQSGTNTGSIQVETPDGQSMGSISLEGLGFTTTLWRIDEASFVSAFEWAFHAAATSSERAIFGLPDLTHTLKFSESESLDFLRKVSARVDTLLFSDLKAGLQRAEAGSTVVTGGFLTSCGAGVGHFNPICAPRGQTSIDWNESALSQLAKNRHEYNVHQQAYLLSIGLNTNTGTETVNIYPDAHLLNAFASYSEEELVRDLAKTVGHEIGHSLGLPHTDDDDIMRQGLDSDGIARFSVSLDAAKVALGMDWNANQLSTAIDFVMNDPQLGELAQDATNPSDDHDAPPLVFDSGLLWLVDAPTLDFADRIDWGMVLPGTSVTRQFRLVNVGGLPVRVDRLEVAGGNGQFRLLSSVPARTLLPGESVLLEIEFDARIPGDAEGQLIIRNDSQVANLAVALSGQTQPASPSIAGEIRANNFGGQRIGAASGTIDHVATLKNNGREPLQISAMRWLEGSDAFQLVGVPANLSSNPIQLGAGGEFHLGARFQPVRPGLARGILEITSNDPNLPRLRLSVVGTGLTATTSVAWGNDYVVFETPRQATPTVLRTRSDSSGRFELFVPDDVYFHVSVFDKESSLVGHDYGFTPASGTPINLTATMTFAASKANDSDTDGLPDDIELAIGSSISNPDSDRDGIDDFIELMQGLDPLDGLPAQTGIVATLPVAGGAAAVVVAAPAGQVGQNAYVATTDGGLAIIDASRFDRPLLLGQLDLPGSSLDVAVDSRLAIAAVAAGNDGLLVIDVADPAQPRILHAIRDVLATQVEITDGGAWVTAGQHVVLVDLLSGETLESLLLPGNGQAAALAVEGNSLLVLDTSGRLRGVDLSQQPPAFRNGTVQLSNAIANSAGQLFVAGGMAYSAARSYFRGGYYTVDVGDLDDFGAPQLYPPSGTTGFPRTAVSSNQSGTVVEIGRVPGANVDSLVALSVRTAEPSVLGRFDLPENSSPSQLALAAGLAFVAHGAAGLQVINYLPYDSQGQPPEVVIGPRSGDADPDRPGLQAVEGKTYPIEFVQLSDDGQIGRVELLVNGMVTIQGVSAPFDLSAFLPTIAEGGSSATIQARVTDTGGNVALSNLLNVELIRDNVAPTLTRTSPTEGSSRGRSYRTVRLEFSEPIDFSGLRSEHFRLQGDADSTIRLPREIRSSASARSIWLTFDALPVDDYELKINQSAIKDRSGNALGTTESLLHFSIVPASAVWNNPSGGNWDDPRNWVDEKLPGPGDDVLIETDGNATVTFRTGTVTIQSLVSNAPFVFSGGTLTVTDTLQVNNQFTLRGGTLARATIIPGTEGQGITVTSLTNLDGVKLQANLTVNSFTSVQVLNGLLLSGDLTLDTADNRQSSLYVRGDIQGTGRIVVTGTGTANLYFNDYQEISSLGPNITVEATGKTLQLGYSSSYPWENLGTIRADGALVELVGSFTTAGLGQILHNGATVVLQGQLDNRNATWNLDQSATWRIDGGEIQGGNLAVQSGASLSVESSATLIDAVNLSGRMELATRQSSSAAVYFQGETAGLFGTGTVFVSGTGTATLDGYYSTTNWRLGAGITVEAQDRALTLNGRWRNEGMIEAANAQLRWRGNYRTEDLGMIQHAGATVFVQGNLDNSNATLNLDAETNWQLANATILGGTITVVDPAKVEVTSSSTLDAVTLQGGLSIHSNISAQILNGLTLNGDLTLDTADNRQSSLYVRGDIQGTGRIVVSGTGTANLYFNDYQELSSLGPNITVEATGKKLQLGYSSSYPWENRGTIRADGALVELVGSFTTAGLGQFLHNGATVVLQGQLDNRNATWNLDQSATWRIDGGEIQGGNLAVQSGASLSVESSATLIDAVNLSGRMELATRQSSSAAVYFQGETAGLFGTGTVFVSGTGTATLDGYYSTTNWRLGAGITVEAQDRALTLNGRWRNEGMIEAANAQLRWRGNYRTEDLGMIQHAGATVFVQGSLDNSNATLNLDAQTNWQLANATILGGTITVVDPAKVEVTSSSTLDAVTLQGGLSINSNTSAQILNGLTLNGDLTLDTADNRQSSLYIRGDIQGTGRIVVTGTGTANLFFNDYQELSSLGPNITVEATGKKLQLGYSSNYPWENMGTIRADGALVELVGSFSTAGLGQFLHNGATVVLQGQLDNRNATLVIDAATIWQLDGATILGGLVAGNDPSSQLQVLSSGGELDGVTLAVATTVNGGYITIRNGLTVNAELTLQSQSTSGTNTLFFEGEQSLSGNGSIRFAGNSSRNLLQNRGQLTIQAPLTIQSSGQGGTLGYSSNTIVNQGTIAALTPGRAIIVESNSDLTQAGVIQVAAGATVEIKADFNQTSTGMIGIDITSATDFGKLIIRDSATFAAGSKLNLTRSNGFTPGLGQSFPVITYGTRSGTLDIQGVILGSGLAFDPRYNAANLTLVVVAGGALRASGSPASMSRTVLSSEVLSTFIGLAIQSWQAAGLPSDPIDALANVRIEFADLEGDLLGYAAGQSIWVDWNAAGFGWNLDVDQGSFEGIDLLTVLAHELGHYWGLDDWPAESAAGQLMSDRLSAGERRAPTAELVDLILGRD